MKLEVSVSFYYDRVYDNTDSEIRKFADGAFDTIAGDSTITTAMRNGTPVTVISYTLVDGGINDEDGEVNGEIVDPAGLAVMSSSDDSNDSDDNLSDSGYNMFYYIGVGLILFSISGFILMYKNSRNELS